MGDKIGFIGIGNMGGAILKGYLSKAGGNASELAIYDTDSEKMEAAKAAMHVKVCNDIPELTACSDVIIVGVKPNLFEDVLPQIQAKYHSDKIVVSMAAGVSISFVMRVLGEAAKVIRIMPNMPALVGEAMVAVARNGNVSDERFAAVMRVFDVIGRTSEVPEDLIHCVIGVSGSSPAYTYMYIEALAEAAVKNGMDKQQAVVFAAQSVLGAAKMVLETGIDPEQLRINVCSPGGTTIEAVKKLQENGFSEKVAEAFQAATEKSKMMTK